MEPFSVDDFARARDLMDECAHLGGFGIADASNVVLVERYGTRNILTTDQRGFREIELHGGRYFRILPYDRRRPPQRGLARPLGAGSTVTEGLLDTRPTGNRRVEHPTWHLSAPQRPRTPSDPTAAPKSS